MIQYISKNTYKTVIPEPIDKIFMDTFVDITYTVYAESVPLVSELQEKTRYDPWEETKPQTFCLVS